MAETPALPAFLCPEIKKRPPDPKIRRPHMFYLAPLELAFLWFNVLCAAGVISLTSLCQFTWSVVRPSSVCLYRWSAFVCLRPAPRIIIHITVSAPRLDHRIFAPPVTYALPIQSHRLCSPTLCYQDLLHPCKPLGNI